MKKRIALGIFFAATVILAQLSSGTANADLSAGLVAHWKFDDGADPTEDAAGSNDAALIGGPAFASSLGLPAAPIFGTMDAIVLDNPDQFDPSLVKQYLQVDPNDFSPELDVLGPQFTLSAWVKLDRFNLSTHIISRAYCCPNGPVGPSRGWTIGVGGSGSNDLVLNVANTTDRLTVVSADTVPLNQFVHLAGIFDSSQGRADLYVNGVKVPITSTFINGSFPTAPGVPIIPLGSPGGGMKVPVTIGAHFGAINENNARDSALLDGIVDDARVYNRALSSEEIFDLYKSTIRVAVDVIPGDATNTIDVDSGEAIMAILSSEEFDASDGTVGVDPDAFFAGSPRLGFQAACDHLTFNTTDVDGDGLDDASCTLFVTTNPDQLGESHTSIQANTLEGFPIEGDGIALLIASADKDGDGVADAIDNCPNDSNPGQEDSDGDGKGDVCDNKP